MFLLIITSENNGHVVDWNYEPYVYIFANHERVLIDSWMHQHFPCPKKHVSIFNITLYHVWNQNYWNLISFSKNVNNVHMNICVYVEKRFLAIIIYHFTLDKVMKKTFIRYVVLINLPRCDMLILHNYLIFLFLNK